MAFQKRRSMVDMTIKPFKAQPKLPENFESNIWASLEIFIDAMFDKTSTQFLCRMELYTGVEELVLQQQSQHLLMKLVEKCNRHILQKFNALTAEDLMSSSFLEKIHTIWENYYTSLHNIRQVFLPLDRLYIINTESQSFLNVGYSLFRRCFCELSPLKQQTFHWFINQLTEKRNQLLLQGGISSSTAAFEEEKYPSLLKSITKMLLTLNLYEEEFEEILFAESDHYFQLEGQEKVKILSISSYLAHVEQRLLEEENAILRYLDEHSRPVLMDIVRRTLIENFLEFILNKQEISNFLKKENILDFRRMYFLLSQIDGLDSLKTVFLDCVEHCGQAIVKTLPFDNPENSPLLSQLFELKQTTDRIWTEALNENKQFSVGLKERWELFLNADVSIIKAISLRLAKFCNYLLTTHTFVRNKNKFLTKLTQMMFIFQYLQGKDYFVEYYKNEVYARSLSKKSIEEEYETLILEKLKEECGNDFTASIEDIFKDVKESQKVALAFYKDGAASTALAATGVKFDVRLFARNVWTHLQALSPVQFPETGEILQQQFLSFYQKQKMYEKRVLMWYPHLGSAILQATLRPPAPHARSPKTFELHVSQLQAICLLQFNETDECSFKDLRDATSIEEEELYRQLMGLTSSKNGALLSCLEEHKERDKRIFRVNLDFSPKASRLTFSPLLQETKIKTEEAEKRVKHSRFHGIDAAIVRTMKDKRILKHSELLSLVFPLLPFHPKMEDMQQCIDSLISRTYIEKLENLTAEEEPTYTYVV